MPEGVLTYSNKEPVQVARPTGSPIMAERLPRYMGAGSPSIWELVPPAWDVNHAIEVVAATKHTQNRDLGLRISASGSKLRYLSDNSGPKGTWTRYHGPLGPVLRSQILVKELKSQNWLAWPAKCSHTLYESFPPPKPPPTPIW